MSLDLECYLAIRKAAKYLHSGLCGRTERTASARRRGTLKIVMFCLKRDAGRNVSVEIRQSM